MIERKVWIQCESCQSHILVSNEEKGKRILCPMCNNACTIPEQEATPSEYNEEYEIKNQGLVNEFFSVCPHCHTPYRFPNSMNKQEMVCLKCHTLFMPSSSSLSSERKIYTNTRNEQSINLYDQLKKNKVGNQLKGSLGVCFKLLKIANNDSKGKMLKIFFHLIFLFLLYIIINGSIVSVSYTNLISPWIKNILFPFITMYTTLSLSDGCLLYFRNMRSDSGSIGDFLTCLGCFKLEFLKTLYLQGISYIFTISAGLVIYPYLIITYLLLGCFLVLIAGVLFHLSILFFIDNGGNNPWQCIKESSKIMRANFGYIIGAIIFNSIKFFLATIGLTILIGLIFGILGILNSTGLLIILGIPIFLIFLGILMLWSFQTEAIYAIVYELTRD